jgi:predicted nucleic acid-binding protein
VVDTDVLIDYLRNHADAMAFVEGNLPSLRVSTVSVAELYAGVREGAERERLVKFLNGLEIVPVSREIAEIAGLFKRRFGRSHAVEIPDALIAATAALNGWSLATLNTRHFPMLTDVFVPYRKPS